MNKDKEQLDPNDMEMPCPCQKCGGWFDLLDGVGSTKWFPNTVICESCAQEEDEEIERDDEISDLKNDLSDAEFTIKECTRRLKELGEPSPLTEAPKGRSREEILEEHLAVHRKSYLSALPEIYKEAIYAAMTEYANQREEWISVEDGLPKVDMEDEWNTRHEISEEVLTYSEFGRRFGRHYHQTNHWQVNSVSSTTGIKVTHWQPLPTPPTKQK